MTVSKRKGLAMPLTELRANLFRVGEAVLSGETDLVSLTLKGHDDTLVLLRASALAALEREVEALRRRSAPDPRPLRELGHFTRDADDVITTIRGRAAVQAVDKLASTFSGAYATPAVPRRAVAEPRPAGRSSRRRP